MLLQYSVILFEIFYVIDDTNGKFSSISDVSYTPNHLELEGELNSIYLWLIENE